MASIAIQHLLRLLTVTVVTVLLLIIVLLVAVLSLQPSVSPQPALNETELRQIERWVADHTPANWRSQAQRELQLSEQQLNLLGRFVASAQPGGQPLAADFQLTDEQVQARISRPLNLGITTAYLNMTATLNSTGSRWQDVQIHAGALPVPQSLLLALVNTRLNNRDAQAELRALLDSLQLVSLSSDQLVMTLQWAPDTVDQLRNQAQLALLGDEDRERLLSYYREIINLADSELPNTNSTSLHLFMPSLFSLAARRSQASGDAIAENRALLQALSLYSNGLTPADVMRSEHPDTLPDPQQLLRTTLFGRADLSQHFITAAALAASAGTGIAEFMANTKEVFDRRARTGFSFSDMTANIAGVTLGEALTENETRARVLQQRLAAAFAETDYMPVPQLDADGLNESQFQERFVDRSSELYNARIARITDDVLALPIYID